MRLAILGGTFDPVHRGHIETARELLDLLSLDRLDLMPCQRHALQKQPLASTEQRLDMLALATGDEPRLGIDRRETGREGVSYTVDSLRDIRREQGADAVLFFVLGADAFLQLERWHCWRELIDYANLVVVQRPGSRAPATTDSPALGAFIEAHGVDVDTFGRRPAGELAMFALTPYDLSSSAVREYCKIAARGEPNLQLQVPLSVAEYIETHKLYRAVDA